MGRFKVFLALTIGVLVSLSSAIPSPRHVSSVGSYEPSTEDVANIGRRASSCSFIGNSDLYGLGVRLGVYLQILATILVNTLLPSEKDTIMDTNTVFLFALLIALIKNTLDNQLKVIEYIIMLRLACCFIICALPVVSLSGIGRMYARIAADKDLAAPGTMLSYFCRQLVVSGVVIFNAWFWFDGFAAAPEAPHGICEPLSFFFVRVSANGGVKVFYKVFAVLVAVIYLLLSSYALLFAILEAVLLPLVGLAVVIELIIFLPPLVIGWIITKFLYLMSSHRDEPNPERKRRHLIFGMKEFVLVFQIYRREYLFNSQQIFGQQRKLRYLKILKRPLKLSPTMQENASRLKNGTIYRIYKDIQYPSESDVRVKSAKLAKLWDRLDRKRYTFLRLPFIALWIWSVISIELTLKWNGISSVNSLGSVGQLIPFVTGTATFVMVIWKTMAAFEQILYVELLEWKAKIETNESIPPPSVLMRIFVGFHGMEYPINRKIETQSEPYNLHHQQLTKQLHLIARCRSEPSLSTLSQEPQGLAEAQRQLQDMRSELEEIRLPQIPHSEEESEIEHVNFTVTEEEK